MKGYFRVLLTGVDRNLPPSSRTRTGEQRLTIIEKTLHKAGIEFVEDFDGDSVIVRYGNYVNDELWDTVFKLIEPTKEPEPIEEVSESLEVYA